MGRLYSLTLSKLAQAEIVFLRGFFGSASGKAAFFLLESGLALRYLRPLPTTGF